ncbi:MarR family transcriptional regulator [Rhodovulum sp. NI22]|jgi:MarR family transcriptional regulator for hemolysin|nr:MarR family transcriptional regulator [Rhodovulum sp. NI22]
MSDDTLLIDALFRVMRELRRHYDLNAQAMGLTMARARVVSTLAKMEGATQSELATAIGIEAPTLKRQIDALEAGGFLERRGLDDDARKRALFLTEKARSSRISNFDGTVRTEILDGISPQEQQLIRAALERIADNAAGLNRK